MLHVKFSRSLMHRIHICFVHDLHGIIGYLPLNGIACFCLQNNQMAELKQRVQELQTENEYQLRLKDMSYNEKIKELTEKFIEEMEALKTKNQVNLLHS